MAAKTRGQTANNGADNGLVSTDAGLETANPEQFAYVELGATGLRQFSGYVREEWLRDLQGWRGLRMYREMRDNDPIIGAMFFALEMPLRGISFTVQPEDATNKDDVEAAAFVTSCMADMEHSWPGFISEVLTFLQYGYSLFEIVYKIRGGPTSDQKTNSRYSDGMVGWRKFAGRAQETCLHWDFDDSGDAVSFVQLLPTGAPLLRVPTAKCLHFRTRLLKNNPEGVSLMRNCYTSYFYKKRLQEIEAIGIERDLCGLPMFWVPARLLNINASPEDKAQLAAIKSIVRDTTRNQQEGFVGPLVYDDKGNPLYKFELMSTGGSRQIDITPVIDRYDHRMAASLLADFIMLGQGAAGRSQGTGAQSKNKTDMFSVAITGFADLIAAEFNRKPVPDLLAMNNLKGRCIVKHGDVSESSVADFAASVSQVASAGVVMPDAAVENAVRIKLGLPPLPGATTGDLNEGGDAVPGGDTSGSRTQPRNARQGQGQGGDAV